MSGALDRVGGLHGRPVMSQTMRHRWLLLGACGWVLLILMFASKFISFRTSDGKAGEMICLKGGRVVPPGVSVGLAVTSRFENVPLVTHFHKWACPARCVPGMPHL